MIKGPWLFWQKTAALTGKQDRLLDKEATQKDILNDQIIGRWK